MPENLEPPEILLYQTENEHGREIEHYSLDAILSVGYRVRSERGTQFRRWATQRLREYLVKRHTLKPVFTFRWSLA